MCRSHHAKPTDIGLCLVRALPLMHHISHLRTGAVHGEQGSGSAQMAESKMFETLLEIDRLRKAGGIFPCR